MKVSILKKDKTVIYHGSPRLVYQIQAKAGDVLIETETSNVVISKEHDLFELIVGVLKTKQTDGGLDEGVINVDG